MGYETFVVSPSANRCQLRCTSVIRTRAQALPGRYLGRIDHANWQDLRRSLNRGRQARTARTRFRRDPDAYLSALERQAQQQTLPP